MRGVWYAKGMKKLVMLGVVAAFVPVVALAAYVEAGNNASTPAVPIAQNVYLAGGTVNVPNPVAGDVIAAGGNVLISGKVDKDIMAVGGTVNIVGGSAEDVRVAGGNITISGKVNGEIAAAGGQLTVTPETTVVKDSYLFGGLVIFSGSESGNLTIVGGDVRIDGTVNGNVKIKRAEKVSFGPNARVKGAVEYSAPVEAVVSEGAQLASAPVFTKVDSLRQGVRPKLFAALAGVALVVKLLAVLTAAYLLWFLRRRDVTAAVAGVHTHFWNRLVAGFAVLILAPIAGIVLMSTIIGWIPGMVMLALYCILLTLTAPVSVIVTSSFIMAVFKKGHLDLKWYHLLGSALILGVLGLIPVIGWLACAIIFLVSLGAVAEVMRSKLA